MNNMRLCHVFEEDYDTLEEVVVYQFGRMYELDSELANIYAFSKTYTNNSYDLCKAGIRVNDLISRRTRDTGVMRVVKYTNLLLPYFVEEYALPLAQ